LLEVLYTRQFEKDVKKSKKRGKDLGKLKKVLQLLIDGAPLSRQYKDHILVGNYKDRRECHLEPDWLLIYKVDTATIVFERTGSHSDLFK